MANLSDMMSETAKQMGGRPMAVQSDDVSCAETDGSTLFFSSAFMSSLESHAGSDGVRFVVAHELGHQVVGMDVGGHAGEFAADAFAARALAHAGGNFSAIASVFGFLGESDASTHPSNSARVAAARTAYVNARAELGEVSETKKTTGNKSHERDLAI